MMKKTSTILLCCAAAAGLAFAQTQQMRIHYTNGTTELKEVSEIEKITFVTTQPDTPVDPSDPDDPKPTPTAQMVDLGLPSGTKWAAWNMGASKPEDFGNYYAYGEIEPKSDYIMRNYKWLYYDWEFESGLMEWEYYLKLGANFSGTNYDVAHVNWGDKWRMPSRDEWAELFDNCTKSWVESNGVTGARFTSTINGNSIFIPAAGNRYNGELDHVGYNGMYWTPEEYDYFDPDDNECRNYRVDISSTYSNYDGYDYPWVGFTIRPVYGDLPEPELPSVKIPDTTEAVDLGLPSGTLWAPYNVGANIPTEYGLYFCYGELTEKYYSHTYNYKFYDPLTGKCKQFEGGDIKGTEYDAATVYWGDEWEMPNKDQIQELIDECRWVKSGTGYYVYGPNGKSIFLPAGGQMTYMGIQFLGSSLLYPSSTETPAAPGNTDYGYSMSYGVAADGGSVSLRSWCSKESGKPLRAVRSKK